MISLHNAEAASCHVVQSAFIKKKIYYICILTETAMVDTQCSSICSTLGYMVPGLVHHPLHEGRVNCFLSCLWTKVLHISALHNHSINNDSNLHSSSEWHRKEPQMGSARLVTALPSRDVSVAPGTKHRHPPRDGTAAVQIRLGGCVEKDAAPAEWLL